MWWFIHICSQCYLTQTCFYLSNIRLMKYVTKPFPTQQCHIHHRGRYYVINDAQICIPNLYNCHHISKTNIKNWAPEWQVSSCSLVWYFKRRFYITRATRVWIDRDRFQVLAGAGNRNEKDLLLRNVLDCDASLFCTYVVLR